MKNKDMQKGFDKVENRATVDQLRPGQSVAHAQKSRKQALIVTIYAPENVRNLGNTLQHYALQEAVKSLGLDVSSFICPLYGFSAIVRARRRLIYFAKLPRQMLVRAVKLFLAIVGSKKYRKALHDRIAQNKLSASQEYIQSTETRGKIFADFYKKYIDGIIRSTYKEVLDNGEKYSGNFDYIIAGSDQIWNKVIVASSEALRFYYLIWAEKEKRICYAPSYGDKTPSERELPLHRKGLAGFERLSCREKSGCDFIRDLTGREAELVLDPTLLLTAEQWRAISRKPDCHIPEHYVLRYCWGGDAWRDEQLKLADGREIVDVLSREKGYYRHVGPREFIWLIDHADFVFSESFHGTAFAVNMGKNFLSFMNNRNNHGRIGSLLSSVGLSGHIYEQGMKSVPDDIDYEAVRGKLDELRAGSMRYLRECLKV